MAERDENVYKAKLAEQAERYNELPDHGKGEELFQYSNAVKLLQPNLSTSFADKDMDVKLGNLKNMILEKNRLKTFDQWIYHNDKNVSCSSEKMAKAGFFMDCLEDPSSATCFCCLKTLNGWEKNDSPFEEHQKHSPKCLFVKLEKEESELTVCEMLLIAEEVDSNLLELEYSEQIKKLEKLRGNLKNRLIQNRKSVPQLS